MGIRHILIYVNSKQTDAVDAAFQLARQYDAAITALFVVPLIRPTAMWGYLPDEEQIETLRQQAKSRGKNLQQQLQVKADEEDVVFNFVMEEGYPHESLVNAAKYADLTILCKGEPGVKDVLIQDLLYQSGHPVLLIPKDTAVEQIGHRVVIGWKPAAAAARAVTSAIPILAKSSSVTVTEVLAKKDDRGRSSGNKVIEYLAYHDIEATLDRVADDSKITIRQTDSTGPEIAGLLKSCETANADLLVLGAYGHSKAREWIFGGVTQYMLEEASLPLLLMH